LRAKVRGIEALAQGRWAIALWFEKPQDSCAPRFAPRHFLGDQSTKLAETFTTPLSFFLTIPLRRFLTIPS
jgi:hypothetical protein